MRLLLKCIVFCIVVSSSVYAQVSGGTVKAVNSVILHDNYLEFGSDVSDILFTMTDYSVTAGQPWEGVTSPGKNKLLVKSGRSNSASNVEWVKRNIVVNWDGRNTIGQRNHADLPARLNFAIKGTLSFKCMEMKNTRAIILYLVKGIPVLIITGGFSVMKTIMIV